MIVLDTNVVSEVFRPHPDTGVVAWLESLTGDVAITSVTLAELLVGIRRMPDGQRKASLSMRVDTAIQPYRDSRSILVFDDSAAGHYADIVAERELSGRPISMGDALIAAICRNHNASCATRNTQDFAGTGIDLIDPWQL